MSPSLSRWQYNSTIAGLSYLIQLFALSARNGHDLAGQIYEIFLFVTLHSDGLKAIYHLPI